MDKSKAFILWFDQIGIEDVPLVGGKNASLGEMFRNLTPKGVLVPNGFAITADAYHYFVDKNNLRQKIKDTLKGLDTHDVKNIQVRGKKVRNLLEKATFPEDLKKDILAQYRNLCGAYNRDRSDIDVAVRSSATAEDLPDASFAGQQETYLNIHGDEAVLEACRKCFASLFTDRAISYREDKGFDHFSIGLSIGVQKMVRSDLASSGVMFSIDTESGFRDACFVTAAYGLGENVVQGAVNPDEYYVFKPTLRHGKRSIISKHIGSKKMRMIYTDKVQKDGKYTANIDVPEADQKRFVLSDDEILTLAHWAVAIEDHYSQKAGKFKPMDMEWAKDGQTGKLFIVQARPETVASRKDFSVYEEYHIKEKPKALAKGHSVGTKVGQGEANVILSAKDIDRFRKGQVLVTEMTDPDWEPIMKIASAIITNRGGRTCHAAIISRELGIPCVVGTNNGTDVIKSGQKVTVSCAEGDVGLVYDGMIPFEKKVVDLKKIPATKTKIMMNVGTPDQAFNFSMIPSDGVGLARMEFIINSFIRIHPLALIHPEKVADEKVRKEIDEHTAAWDDKKQFFVDQLAYGIAMIGAAFYPKDVIVRMSDFKSNEYANLMGGHYFEPKEDNPMIGWRGASRYYNPRYSEGFALECKAMLKVRDEMGLTNVKVMIPFCRTVDEGQKVIDEMRKNGLVRGENGLQVYVMCEIPANVILADQFCDIFDGFSIGSNDLTQLTLGLDRDSEIVSSIYDERNDAVKRLIYEVIKTAKHRHRKIGICGQAPSDYPEFAQFLVECGIDSISLNPDTVIKTRIKIAQKEKELGINPDAVIQHVYN
ncbi:phosphoenolpyruvate synthase [Candidatus Woesearchaeota archaeon]|nr:phosphoenolpyruvate synthase [Candidatus Woesearchaeota archaeon]